MRTRVTSNADTFYAANSAHDDDHDGKRDDDSLKSHTDKWHKIFKNGPGKICERQPLKNLK